MEHFHIPRPSSRQPLRLTSRSTHYASRDHRPNSFQGRNPSTCCICCVAKDHWEPSVCNRTQSRVPLTRLLLNLPQDTSKHGYSGDVKESTEELNGILLSSVMRVGSVCMRVMDVYVVSVTFRRAFANNAKTPPQASWCGGHQLHLTITFGVSTG